ncbi:hypothetical protein AK812_SmicGene3485 [Symbiodinium microadriaticum]|uniref:Uncharacterized protein n=1 Tax=Symbiodinium microadriaticum TaxID=2951 RepID=A0A1Q9EYL5_SYMMI|nr:hypothetical protein AK812_SmicGene3485 [Symbiodinium microadriaticum]
MADSKRSTLDYGRGVLNFGDEGLYLAVLSDYASQLLVTVKQVESFSASGERSALRDEVALLQNSASYLAADRLSLAAAVLLRALESRQGGRCNEKALAASVCEQARATCVEVRGIVAAGGVKGAAVAATGTEAVELAPELAAEPAPRKCTGCNLQ